MATEATPTTNRRATAKAGTKPATTPRKRSTLKLSHGQEQGGAPLTEALDKAKGHLGGGDQSAGKQSAGEGTSGKEAGSAEKPARKARQKASDGKAQMDNNENQGDGGGGSSQQGDGGAADTSTAQGTGTEGVRLGTLQVLVVDREGPGRGGKKVSKDEDWPFVSMPFGVMLPNGRPKGPSFFVPRSANPDGVVAAGRKRLRGQPVSIVTRKIDAEEAIAMELGDEQGILVWKIEGAGK